MDKSRQAFQSLGACHRGPSPATPLGPLTVCYPLFSLHPRDVVRAGVRRWGQGLYVLEPQCVLGTPGELTGHLGRALWKAGANHRTIWLSRTGTGKVRGCALSFLPVVLSLILLASQYLVEIELRVFLFRQSLQATE